MPSCFYSVSPPSFSTVPSLRSQSSISPSRLIITCLWMFFPLLGEQSFILGGCGTHMWWCRGCGGVWERALRPETRFGLRSTTCSASKEATRPATYNARLQHWSRQARHCNQLKANPMAEEEEEVEAELVSVALAWRRGGVGRNAAPSAKQARRRWQNLKGTGDPGGRRGTQEEWCMVKGQAELCRY